MSWENALTMKISNDVEKYEIEITKMGVLLFTVKVIAVW